MRNKKRAHDRRLSESENSETEDREKYKAKESSGESKCHDTVKPILNRDKLSEPKKSGTIEIEKFQNKNNNHSHKAPCDININNEKIVDKSDESDIKNTAGTEFKNDLIFDLDM